MEFIKIKLKTQNMRGSLKKPYILRFLLKTELKLLLT